MEHGPMRYIRMRWPALILLFLAGCLGTFVLYLSFITGYLIDPPTIPFFIIWGSLSVLFGFVGCVWHYLNGRTYYCKSKLFPDDLDKFEKFHNGLLVVFRGVAKLITHNQDKIEKRNYLIVITYLNRKKKVISWQITTE